MVGNNHIHPIDAEHHVWGVPIQPAWWGPPIYKLIEDVWHGCVGGSLYSLCGGAIEDVRDGYGFPIWPVWWAMTTYTLQMLYIMGGGCPYTTYMLGHDHIHPIDAAWDQWGLFRALHMLHSLLYVPAHPLGCSHLL